MLPVDKAFMTSY